MINGKKVLAIIPARAGSKRLPKKNVLPLCGKPLITWTIEAAKNSEYIDEVFVSTDDRTVMNIAEANGLIVPELRPNALSSDYATTKDVILYTLKKMQKELDLVVLLQPTSPLRVAKHIDEAIELYIHKEALSVVSVTPCEHSPLWSGKISNDLDMTEFLSSIKQVRSQELELYHRLNGAIYIYDIKNYLERSGDGGVKTFAYIMDNFHSIDIDTKFDFDIAEFLLRRLGERS